jgi:hypothetical protein
MKTPRTTPTRTTYQIALAAGGRETDTGWVLEDFAARKGTFFWEFTHLPTGLLVNTHPCIETLKGAKAQLKALRDGTAPQLAFVASAYGPQRRRGS